VDPASGTILLLDAKTQLSRAAESDLTLAGFAVLRVPEYRKLLEAARGRNVAALVVPLGVTAGAWRRWNREPELRRVPVILLVSRPERRLMGPWPLGVFIRADACLSAADLKRRGATADAVRALGPRRAGIALTRRERSGEALWYAGSVMWLLGMLVALLALVELATGRTPAAILMSVVFIGAGRVLMDLGENLGLDQRPRLRLASGIWLGLALLALRALLAQR